MNIGERIRERREFLGLSQEGAAVKAGISASTWQDYEYDNRATRRATTKRKIALALDWPANALELLTAGVEPETLVSTEPVAIERASFDDDEAGDDAWLLEARVRRLERRMDRIIAMLSTPTRSINHGSSPLLSPSELLEAS